MSMTLTSGRESRMEGAPPLPDPEKEARTRAVAIHLLTQFGEPVTEESLRAIMPDAERMAAQYSTPQFEAAAIEASRAGMDAAVARGTANAAGRASQRRAARGVVPEDLPPGEFGVASGREVQEYNRPVEEAEAVLGMEQDVADRIARGLREGRPDWEAEGERQFLQERGEQNPMAAQGDRDMDLRRSIMQKRGQFFEMPDGTMIPVGREPTAADFRNERAWRKWVSETPGSERQARYDPQGYETYREGVREGIRENAQEEMATYGMGVSDPAVREELGIAPLTPEQATARNRRDRSEDRVREAQRGRFYAQRLQNDTGMPAGTDIAAMEAERFRQRDAARKDDLAARRERASMNARLAGGQPTAGSRAAVQNMIQGRDRFDTLIDRLGQENMTDWQRAGIIAGLTPQAQTANPTPLGVDAVGAQNAMRFVTADVLAGNQPGAQDARKVAVRGAEAALPLNVRADAERDKNAGVLPANTAVGQDVLTDIARLEIGNSYATREEVRRAVARAVGEGIPEADAIAFFRRHAEFANSGFWGAILGPGDFGGQAAPPAAPAPASRPSAHATGPSGPF